VAVRSLTKAPATTPPITGRKSPAPRPRRTHAGTTRLTPCSPDRPPRDRWTDGEVVAAARELLMEERALTAEEAQRWLELQAVVELRTVAEVARAMV
jgi:hypothetical protein